MHWRRNNDDIRAATAAFLVDYSLKVLFQAG
jgi:hypothetical protein